MVDTEIDLVFLFLCTEQLTARSTQHLSLYTLAAARHFLSGVFDFFKNLFSTSSLPLLPWSPANSSSIKMAKKADSSSLLQSLLFYGALYAIPFSSLYFSRVIRGPLWHHHWVYCWGFFGLLQNGGPPEEKKIFALLNICSMLFILACSMSSHLRRVQL